MENAFAFVFVGIVVGLISVFLFLFVLYSIYAGKLRSHMIGSGFHERVKENSTIGKDFSPALNPMRWMFYIYNLLDVEDAGILFYKIRLRRILKYLFVVALLLILAIEMSGLIC